MEGAISSPPNTRYCSSLAAAGRIAVVTGGNKGIGLELCRQLAGNGITVILTARDEKRGKEAAGELKGLGLSGVMFHQLDITDTSSIARLAEFLKTRFGKLDILVNNAAIGATARRPDECLTPAEEELKGLDAHQRLAWLTKNSRETYDAAKEGVDTNYYGAKHVTEALLPLLQSSPDGRIVNVSSDFGLLRRWDNEELKQELNYIDGLTEQRLDEVLEQFLRDFEAGALEARGWPRPLSAYKVAKAALNAYTRLLARRCPALRVNSAHPGYVKTDMTRHSGLLTPEQGAASIVRVALLPDGGPSGTFFDEGREAPFV